MGHFLSQDSARTPHWLRITSRLICLSPEAIPKLDPLTSFVSGTCTQVSTPLSSQVLLLLSSSSNLFSAQQLSSALGPHQHRHTPLAFVTWILNVSSHNMTPPFARECHAFSWNAIPPFSLFIFSNSSQPLDSASAHFPWPCQSLCLSPVSIASAKSY